MDSQLDLPQNNSRTNASAGFPDKSHHTPYATGTPNSDWPSPSLAEFFSHLRFVYTKFLFSGVMCKNRPNGLVFSRPLAKVHRNGRSSSWIVVERACVQKNFYWMLQVYTFDHSVGFWCGDCEWLSVSEPNDGSITWRVYLTTAILSGWVRHSGWLHSVRDRGEFSSKKIHNVVHRRV